MEELKKRLATAQTEIAELLLKTAKDMDTTAVCYQGNDQKVRMLCEISGTISNACHALSVLTREHVISFGEIETGLEVIKETIEDDAPKAEAKPEEPAEEPKDNAGEQAPAE